MRKAFTLIELLVVIAIIAILAAILFPVFAQAKAAAKKTQALSNAKQVLLGFNMYINDYDGVYPEHAVGMASGIGGGTSSLGPNSLIWNGTLQPYMKNTQLVNDPMANTPTTSYNNTTYTGKYYIPIDYKQLALGYNWNFTSQLDYACSVDFSPGEASCAVFFNESQIQFPAQFLLVASSAQRTPTQTGDGFWVSPLHNVDADNGLSDRHSGGLTIVGFIEGHAKALHAKPMLVSDQVVEIDPNASGQCVNYDAASVYWDPSAPMPTDFPLCEGHGIR